MRFRAPAREAVDPACFAAPLFDGCRGHAALTARDWPPPRALNAELARSVAAAGLPPLQFVEQDPALLADGLHYETRIARDGRIACRPGNWHDLLNALVWLQQPRLKLALSRRQAADVERFGPRLRSRAQCALTHFDEAGVLVVLRDPARLRAWDAHDWPGLFSGLQAGDFALAVVGHALLEHGLRPGQLLCGKALAWLDPAPAAALPTVLADAAAAITAGTLLTDPQQLRPLPLMGLPGWHPQAGEPGFLAEASCFQPLRRGRRYPPALRISRPPAGDG
jgi:hypothetical protein